MSFFDQSELLDLASERGDRVELCQITTIEGDRSLGIKDEKKLVCQPVEGYLARNRLNQIPLLGTSNDYSSGETRLYINALPSFDPSSIEPTTRFKVNDKVYKIVSVGEEILHQGKPLYYVYNIKDDKN